MGKRAEYTILITDKNLVPQGDPILCWSSLDVTLRFNEPSSALFVAPAHNWIVAQIAPGNRVVVMRNLEIVGGRQGDILIGGPIENWLFERGDDDSGGKSGDGIITVNFADDLAPVVARCVYPDRNATPAAQTVDRWHEGPVSAEVALRDLFFGQAGPGALTARRIPKATVNPTPAGVGSTVTIDADRMMPLGDLAREIARLGGGIGFRTRQVLDGSGLPAIWFEAYQPVDRTSSVRFGFGLGNLRYLAYEMKAPTATTAIVGGQGEGADRNLIERNNTTDEAAWGRSETLVSRPGTSALQSLQDDGDKALADGAPTTRIASNVMDTDDIQFGVHYGLGDKVSIETFPGQSFSDVVMSVTIQAWPTAGTYVAAVVGSQAAKTKPIWQQRLEAINLRLGQLERNVKPAVKPAT